MFLLVVPIQDPWMGISLQTTSLTSSVKVTKPFKSRLQIHFCPFALKSTKQEHLHHLSVAEFQENL